MRRAKEYPIGEVNKLVRDKVPAIIKKRGESVPVTHIATGEEYLRVLRAKLQEEVDELLRAQDPASVAEEIGDIQEVLDVYANHAGLDPKTIEKKRHAKYTTHGGFKLGVVLDRTEKP